MSPERNTDNGNLLDFMKQCKQARVIQHGSRL